jgi:CBS domain containing-hemolysin-like protein
VLTFLPKTKLPTMLELFRKSRSHLAVVVNPQDDMLGIVSFEDVLEELVGDIRDEFDIEKGPIYEMSEEMVLVDAEMPLRDLANETNWPLPMDSNTSVGRWCLLQWGRAPQKREELELPEFRLIAEETSAQGLRRVRIIRRGLVAE